MAKLKDLWLLKNKGNHHPYDDFSNDDSTIKTSNQSKKLAKEKNDKEEVASDENSETNLHQKLYYSFVSLFNWSQNVKEGAIEGKQDYYFLGCTYAKKFENVNEDSKSEIRVEMCESGIIAELPIPEKKEVNHGMPSHLRRKKI